MAQVLGDLTPKSTGSRLIPLTDRPELLPDIPEDWPRSASLRRGLPGVDCGRHALPIHDWEDMMFLKVGFEPVVDQFHLWLANWYGRAYLQSVGDGWKWHLQFLEPSVQRRWDRNTGHADLRGFCLPTPPDANAPTHFEVLLNDLGDISSSSPAVCSMIHVVVRRFGGWKCILNAMDEARATDAHTSSGHSSDSCLIRINIRTQAGRLVLDDLKRHAVSQWGDRADWPGKQRATRPAMAEWPTPRITGW